MLPQIRAGLLTQYRPTIAALGGDADQAIAAAGASTDVFDNPDSFIPYRTYLALLDSAARHTGCPQFGLEMGRHLGAANLGVTGFVLSQGSTIAEAWHSFARFYHVHDTYGHVGFHVGAASATVTYSIPDHTLPGARQSIDVAVAITVNVLRMMYGAAFEAELLQLPYPEPEDLAPFESLPVRSMRFGATPYSLVFGREIANSPIQQADPRLQSILSEYLDQLEASNRHRYSRRVETMIREFLPTGQCTLENIARFLSLSTRTLQNRLSVEHTSFQLLLDKVRREQAEQQLLQGDMQLSAIAHMLGYSELSAFSRSFRRWYGCSPRAWRKEALLISRS
ncbi:MAG: AraC family transcriptional regulator ligand-binding domain-containing protein [Halieaceae bacterium]|nr:AraC family transcriptional regulator ligand-binding domain-containing protein [Halieaceae bacterium]